MRRIAVLHHGAASSPALKHLVAALRGHGVIVGQNCVLEAAGAEGRLHRLPLLAHDLLARSPDVVVAIGAVAALVAQRATCSIPLLHATVLDPAEIGLQARNLAGVTTFDRDHGTRQLRLLKELVPGLRRVACLTDPWAPVGPDGCNPLTSQLAMAAADEAVEVRYVELHEDGAQLVSVAGQVRQADAQAALALEVPAVVARLGAIAAWAEGLALPTIFPARPPAGGLAMLGPCLCDTLRPLAEYIVAVLRGVPVASLPTRWVRNERLVVDVSVARRIGLTVPPSVLKRATRRIGESAARQPATGGAVRR